MTNLSVMENLGILISGASKSDCTPEHALVDSFEVAMSDYRSLGLIHTWVQKNHDLIHAEALISELKSREDSGVIKLIAGALNATGQKRFDRIIKNAKETSVTPTLNKYLSLAVEIGQCNADPSYTKLGLTISEIQAAPDRKFRPRNVMLERNEYFYCRTLFGVNWRADVAACFLLDKAKNPTEVSKFLKCSYDAAYRNYHDLNNAGWSLKARSYFHDNSSN